MSYVSLGAELQHLPFPGISSSGTCAMPKDGYSVVTGWVEDALAERGAAVQSDGIWSNRVCAAWWYAMKQPVSSEAVLSLLGPGTNCTSVTVPYCPKPSQKDIDDAAVPRPGWQADIGGTPLNLWILGGVVALAAVLAMGRRRPL